MNAGNILCGYELRRGISEPFLWLSTRKSVFSLYQKPISAGIKDFPKRCFPMKQQYENSPADESLLLIVIVFITGKHPGKVIERSQNTAEHEKGPAERRRKVKGGLKSNYHIFFWKQRSQRRGREAMRFKDFHTNVSCAAWDYTNPEIVFISVSRDFVKQPSPTNVLKVKFTPVTFPAWKNPKKFRYFVESYTKLNK